MSEYVDMLISSANKNSGFLLVILTLSYCVATFAIVIISRRSNKLSERHLQQAIQMDNASRRPHCSLKLKFVQRSDLPYAFLILQNFGKTSALNIRIELNPTPSTKAIVDDVEKQRVAYFLIHPVSSLAPGEKLHDSIGFTQELYKQFDPPIFSGNITYDDILSNSYKEQVVLDLKMMQEAVLDLENEI